MEALINKESFKMFDVNQKFADLMQAYKITNVIAGEWLDKSCTTISKWRTEKVEMHEAYLKLFQSKLKAYIGKRESIL